MNSLGLVFAGHPALRRVSKSVADVCSPAVQELLQRMESQVRTEEGVGIAAPQMGVNQRAFLMLHPDQASGKAEVANESLRYQEVLNPTILEMSKDTKRDFEGCLSIPGYVAVVERPRSVKVEYYDAQGQRLQHTLHDYAARIFQHEHDHLNGVLYVDRMDPHTFLHNDEFEKMEFDYIQQLLQQPQRS